MLLLIREAECAFVVILSSCKNLEFFKPASNELDELSGALLEFRETVGLSKLGELRFYLSKVGSSPGHEFGLGEVVDFVKLELVLDVDDSLSTRTIILFLLISGDQDGLLAFSNIPSFGLNDGVVHDVRVGVGV